MNDRELKEITDPIWNLVYWQLFIDHIDYLLGNKTMGFYVCSSLNLAIFSWIHMYICQTEKIRWMIFFNDNRLPHNSEGG